MNNKLDVLCIDGANGVGKTTQIILFRNLLNSLKIPNKLFILKEVDDISYTQQVLSKISEYLEENTDSIALVDGSIATDIIDDVVRTINKDDIWEKHQKNLQKYAAMNNIFNFVNILLTPDDVNMCYERVKKRAEVYGHDVVELDNKEHLQRTIFGLETFDDSIVTTNISFKNIIISENDTILDIHEKIKNIIKETHQIKKPS